MADVGRLFAQGASLAVMRAPRSRIGLAGFGAFLLAWAAATVVFAIFDWRQTPAPREFEFAALWTHAGFGLALLAAAWVGARVLRRPAIAWTLASLVVLASLPWMVLNMYVRDWMQAAPQLAQWGAALCVWLGVLLVVVRVHWLLGGDAPLARKALAPLLFGLLLIAPWNARGEAWFWYPQSDDEDMAREDVVLDEPAPDPHAARPRPPPQGEDPEALLGRQPAMVEAALAKLAPQVPNHADLFAVGFAGYGEESAFRNEVEFLAQLAPARFGAQGHVVSLINHPGTTRDTPLATLTNLRAALAGVGARMDRDDDVLLLFLTSHGSHDHYLSVEQPPLPLRQIGPGDLRAALDDAGIRWRVIVVSACYSGGFVDALRDPYTLVITAARADRPSFGCGVGSEITWFGQAFLTEALNETTDFRQAYAIAARKVRERELAGDELPSVPQIWVGAQVDAKLDAWRAGLPLPAPAALPFVPAVRVAPE